MNTELIEPSQSAATAAPVPAISLECGADTIFGYPGGSALPLCNALYSEPRPHRVLLCHEQAAVHAAQGHARTTVLSNNGCMGMVRQWEQLNHGNRRSRSYTEALPDFAQLAEAFGWSARTVSDPAELPQALRECLHSDEPYFLDVRLARQENYLPTMPSGQGHHRIMLSEKHWYEDPTATD